MRALCGDRFCLGIEYDSRQRNGVGLYEEQERQKSGRKHKNAATVSRLHELAAGNNWDEGQWVELLYSPADPGNARVARSLYQWPVILVGASLMLLASAWVGGTDHKSVGTFCLVLAFVFLLTGGALAAVLRTQLAQPDLSVLARRPFYPPLRPDPARPPA